MPRYEIEIVEKKETPPKPLIVSLQVEQEYGGIDFICDGWVICTLLENGTLQLVPGIDPKGVIGLKLDKSGYIKTARA